MLEALVDESSNEDIARVLKGSVLQKFTPSL